MDYIEEIIILSIDALIVGTVGYFYNKSIKVLNNAENLKELNLNNTKTKKELPNLINYALVSGEVFPKNDSITSTYKDEFKGVIRIHEVKQHGEKWIEKDKKSTGFVRRIIYEINEKPFYLFNKKSNTKIDVIDAKNADSLLNELETTHYSYSKSNDSFFEYLAKYAVQDEVTTAVETTEKMLKTSSFLYAFGRLEKLSDNSFVISKPVDPDCKFILTRQNPVVVVDNMRTNLKIFKVIWIIVGTIGLITGLYCLHNIFYKTNNDNKKPKRKVD